jgi:hypothetical protein
MTGQTNFSVLLHDYDDDDAYVTVEDIRGAGMAINRVGVDYSMMFC